MTFAFTEWEYTHKWFTTQRKALAFVKELGVSIFYVSDRWLEKSKKAKSFSITYSQSIRVSLIGPLIFWWIFLLQWTAKYKLLSCLFHHPGWLVFQATAKE